jgi:hypothetical protein
MGLSTGKEVSEVAGPDIVLVIRLEEDLLGESFECASAPELPRQKYTHVYKIINRQYKDYAEVNSQNINASLKEGNNRPYPSTESYNSEIFPTERKALRLLASRSRKEGSNGNGFL